MMIVILVGTLMTAIAIPEVQSIVHNYRLRGAVSMATWAIQSTRYQALMEGYPFQVVFTAANNSYLVQSSPANNGVYATVPAGSSAIPISGSPVALSTDTTLQFKPNGSVLAPVGGFNFTLSYLGACQKVTVTNYGNVSITPSNPAPTCP
jgi:Tfp pilus assembly protein FimT